MDNSTDRLRDHVCDKGGEGSKNPTLLIFADIIDGSPSADVICKSINPKYDLWEFGFKASNTRPNGWIDG